MAPLIIIIGFIDQERKFIPRNRWAGKAKDRTLSYTWGGREEQNIVDDMRKKIADKHG